jgi:hypothetical protein
VSTPEATAAANMSALAAVLSTATTAVLPTATASMLGEGRDGTRQRKGKNSDC